MEGTKSTKEKGKDDKKDDKKDGKGKDDSGAPAQVVFTAAVVVLPLGAATWNQNPNLFMY